MPWKVEKIKNVAIVQMNTNKMNAQNEAFFRDLDATFDILEKDYSECSVVLTGQENVFSAGLDFDESFGIFGSADKEKIKKWFYRYRATNLRIFTFPRPTIAALNGHAYAGGLITALNCDFRIASDKQNKYNLNEIQIGIPMPAVYLEIIAYATSKSVSARASLFCEVFDNNKAQELGLIHKVVSSDQLIEQAIKMAGVIQPQSFRAYKFSKAALQKPVLDRIKILDQEFDNRISDVMSDKNSLTALAERYEQIKKERPSWDPR